MITMLRKIGNGESIISGAPLSFKNYYPKSKSSCVLATGRSALYHLIVLLGLTSDDTVLLPAYVAEGLIQPFIKAKIPITFYKLTSDLFPDLNDITNILGSDSSITLCVVIHPMGFEVPLEPIAKILKEKHIWLVEDCAQGIFSKYTYSGPFGEKGDFALYSLNKFLPVTDGAVLLSHIPEVDVSINEKKITPLDKKALKSYKNHLYLNGQIFNTDKPKKAEELLNKSSYSYNLYYSFINRNLNACRVSLKSKEIIENYNYNSLIEKRCRNTSYLYENLSKKKLQLIFKDYTLNIVPMAVPALVPENKRVQWLSILFQKSIMLSTLIDLWNFLPKDELNRYSNEYNYIKSHVLIPINEFLSIKDMEYMVRELNSL